MGFNSGFKGLTAVGLSLGGSSTVHIYTTTIHITTQITNRTIQITTQKPEGLKILQFVTRLSTWISSHFKLNSLSYDIYTGNDEQDSAVNNLGRGICSIEWVYSVVSIIILETE